MKKLTVILILLFVVISYGQHPDTIRVPVTYFDFHSDGRCPDFNPVDDAHKEGITTGMVGATLNADGLPVRGDSTYFSHNVTKWFQPYSEHLEKDVKPVYINDSDDVNHGKLDRLDKSDANILAYENIKIEDTLEFILSDPINGIYEYNNLTFFPIDDKGYGKEPTLNWDGNSTLTDHNYSFSMVLERNFKYEQAANMEFIAKGDDDIWIFVDNKLAIDLGGLHIAQSDTLKLNDVATTLGLVDGNTYTMKMFFAERQANASTLQLTWNFLTKNDPPIIKDTIQDVVKKQNTGPHIIVDLDSIFQDDNSLTYTVESIPDSSLVVGSLDSDNNLILTIVPNKTGEADVVVTATDNIGQSISDTVHIYITDGKPIRINPMSDKAIHKDKNNVVFADLDTVFIDDSVLVFNVKSLDLTVGTITLNGDNEIVVSPQSEGMFKIEAVAIGGSDTVKDTADCYITDGKPIIINPMKDRAIHKDSSNVLFADLDTVFIDDSIMSFTHNLLSDTTNATSSINSDNAIVLTPQKMGAFQVEAIAIAGSDTAKDTANVYITDGKPLVINPLKDIAVVKNSTNNDGGDLDTVFIDETALTFTIENLDNSIAEGTLSGSKIVIDAKDTIGATSIIVTADDGFGNSTKDTMIVYVTDGKPLVVKPMKDKAIHKDSLGAIFADLDTVFIDDSTLSFIVADINNGGHATISLNSENNVVVNPTVPMNLGGFQIIATAIGGIDSVSDTANCYITDGTPIKIKDLSDVSISKNTTNNDGGDLDTVFIDDKGLTFTVENLDSALVKGTLSGSKLLLEGKDTTGVGKVVVVATDGDGNIIKDTIDVTITEGLPVVKNPIKDIAMKQNSTKTLADLATVFESSDLLTYSANSLDPTIVETNLSGTSVELTSKNIIDDTLIIVSAKDTKNQEVFDTVRVYVTDGKPLVVKPMKDKAIHKDSLGAIFADLDTVFIDDSTLSYTVVDENNSGHATISLDGNNDVVVNPTVPANLGKFQIIAKAKTGTDSISDTATCYITDGTPIKINDLSDVSIPKNTTNNDGGDLDTVFIDDKGLTFTVENLDSALVKGTLSGSKLLLEGKDTTGVGKVVVVATDGDGNVIKDTIDVTITEGIPVVKNPIKDLAMKQNSTKTLADLATVFESSDVLTYSTNSLDPTIVESNLSGTSVELTSKNIIDDTLIIVTAEDTKNQKVSDTVRVYVTDGKPLVVKPMKDKAIHKDSVSAIFADLDTVFIDDSTLTFFVSEDGNNNFATTQLDGNNDIEVKPSNEGNFKIIAKAIGGNDTVSDTAQCYITDGTPLRIHPLKDVVVRTNSLNNDIGNVDSVFIDDGTFTYDVKSFDQNIATVSLLNQTILLNAKSVQGTVDVEVTAEDNNGNKVYDTLQVTVTDGNSISVNPLRYLVLLRNVNDTFVAKLDTVFTSLGNLTYSVDSNGDATIATARVSNDSLFVTSKNKLAATNFTLKAEDNIGNSVTDVVKVYVTDGVPIVVKPLRDRAILKNTSDNEIAALDTVFIDDRKVNYSATSLNNNIVTAKINGKMLLLDAKDTIADVDVILTGTDDDNNTVADTVHVYVTDGTPIVLNPIKDTILIKNTTDNQVAVLDSIFIDDDSLTFSILNISDTKIVKGKMINNTLLLDTEDTTGTVTVTVKAVDKFNRDTTDSFVVRVVDGQSIAVTPFKDVLMLQNKSDSMVTPLAAVFTSAQQLFYSVKSNDSTMVLPRVSGDSLYVTSFNKTGISDIIVRAGTIIDSAFDTIKVYVTDGTPIAVNPLRYKAIKEGTVNNKVAWLDSVFLDDQELTYDVTSDNNTIVFGNIGGKDLYLSAGATAQALDSTHITLTATDPQSNNAQDRVLVYVTDGTPHVIKPFSNMTVQKDSSDIYVGDFDSVVVDDGDLTFTVTSNDSTKVVPEVRGGQLYIHSKSTLGLATLTVVASDNDQFTNDVQFTFTVTVQDQGLLVLNPIPDVIFTEGYKDSIIDAQNTTLFDTLVAQLDTVFTGALMDSITVTSTDTVLVKVEKTPTNEVKLSFEENSFGEAFILVTAKDNLGGMVTDTVLVSVTPTADTDDNGKIIDFDVGHKIDSLYGFVKTAPNPAPRNGSSINFICTKDDIDYLEVVIYNSVGNRVHRGKASVRNGLGVYQWKYGKNRREVEGKMFMAVITLYKNNQIVSQEKQMIGVSK